MDPQSRAELLLAWIEEQLRENGPVPFARFMEWALYHPLLGYYTAGPSIGPRGDFVTSPEASPAFGKLLARHVADVDALLNSPSRLDVVEYGPGKGTLACDLLDALRVKWPDLYARVKYHLVEISPALRDTQNEILLATHRPVASWHESTGELPPGMTACVIANEFVDALPVHIVENLGGDLVEQYVTGSNGGLKLQPGRLSDPRLSTFVERNALQLRPGERLEVNLAMDEWLIGLAEKMERGIVTVIDYGDEAPARYSESRRQGTLLGYFRGAVTDDLLANPGLQDLTALVDFTALQHAGAAAGFEPVGTLRQAGFLLGLGLGTEERAEDAAPEGLSSVLERRRGLLSLISMEGLGRFHVLLMSRGASAPAASAVLSGLAYKGVL